MSILKKYEENTEWLLGLNSNAETDYLNTELGDVKLVHTINDLAECRTIRMRSDYLNTRLRGGLKVMCVCVCWLGGC